MKNFIFQFLFSLSLVLTVSTYGLQAQTITLSPEERNVSYELPDPGMLPDNPFFIIRDIKDRLLLWSTADLNEKAKVRLLQADQTMGMALELAYKGKHKLTAETLVQAEEMLLEVPVILEKVQENGDALDKALLEEVRLSNMKHRASIDKVMKSLPQGDDADLFMKAIKINDETKKFLEKLK